MRALVPLLVAVLNLASPVLAQVRGDPDVVAGLMTGAGMKVTHTTSAEGAPMQMRMSGSASSIWRWMKGRQIATSCGVGVRLPGGRQGTVLAM